MAANRDDDELDVAELQTIFGKGFFSEQAKTEERRARERKAGRTKKQRARRPRKEELRSEVVTFRATKATKALLDQIMRKMHMASGKKASAADALEMLIHEAARRERGNDA